MSLREKSSSSEFFWTVFSRIRTEYGEIRIISLYSVRTQENTNQKNSEYGQCSWSVHKRDSTKWTIMNYHLPHLKWVQSKQAIPKFYAILMCYKEVHIECRFVPTHVLLCLETCCLTVWKKKSCFSNLYVKSLVSRNLTISSRRSCMHILTVLKN